jgi:hypothetical protein
MSLDKKRLTWPIQVPETCRGENMEKLQEDIKFAVSLLAIFTRDDGSMDIVFTEFSEDLFATLVVLAIKYPELFQLLKWVVLAAEGLNRNPEKGMDVYNQALKFLKENFCDFVHKEE